MILSDVLRSDVVDAAGHRLGRIADVRFRLEGPPSASRARVAGIIVSPRSSASFLGYERSTLDRPVVLDRLLRFLHRGSFLVDWDDIQRFEDGRVRLRKGFERRSATLPSDDE